MVAFAVGLAETLGLMFGGALVCGALPFYMRVRESRLQAVAALGAGLLIGSALAVIIPEGFHAFAEASHHSHDHDHDHSHDHEEHGEHGEHAEGLPEGVAGLVLVGGFLAMLLLDHLQHSLGGRCGAPGHSHHGHGHSHAHGGSCSGGEGGKEGGCGGAAGGSPRKGPKGKGKAAAAGAACEGRPLLDEPGQSGQAGGVVSAAEAAAAAGVDGVELKSHVDPSGKAKGAQLAAAAGTDPSNALTGLIIHCCADGLAMGAAFLSGNARLSMIIAAAMVLHKAPMAFGLGTYLLACRWSFQRARGPLLIFAAAAPVATLATYLLLGSLAVLQSHAAVALCVIFSGGTFLYAATMHILPEVLGGGGHLSTAQLAAVTAGSLLPVALSWGHHH